MARIFGRVVGQGSYDEANTALLVEWQALNDIGQALGNGNDAIPVSIGLADTELAAACRQGLADLVSTKGFDIHFSAADVIGCTI